MYAGLAVVEAAFPVAYGPVAPKQTATPEPIATAVVISVERFEFAVVEGVVYKSLSPSPVHAGVPLSVKPVPKAVEV